MKIREKIEELQVIALKKYIKSLDDTKIQKKEHTKRDEAWMNVYMILTRDIIRNEVSKVKTNMMKKVYSKFDQIINLIRKSLLV